MGYNVFSVYGFWGLGFFGGLSFLVFKHLFLQFLQNFQGKDRRVVKC